MPFIHIKSFPFEEQVDVRNIIIGIAIEFSENAGIKIDDIHTTWEFYSPGYYAKGDVTPEHQPKNNFPIIVDLLTPDFNDLNAIKVMLESIANSISDQLDFPRNNVFINHRQAHSGMVFDDGKVVKW